MEDTFTWVYKIIESCHIDFHFDSADALILLFRDKYGESEKVSELRSLRRKRWNAVHTVII